MTYPEYPDYKALGEHITEYALLKHEYGARNVASVLGEAEKALKKALRRLQAMPADAAMSRREPDALAAIRALRPKGPRRMWDRLNRPAYRERLAGAFLGRMAGCTLGAPVEFWAIRNMEDWAREIGDAFPPVDYWSAIPEPHKLRYRTSRCDAYTRPKMNGVPVDDDIVYTLLGLLILEDSGPDFRVEDVGRAWLKYLPYACTAEKVALENLKAGIPARKVAEKNNPYVEWIGADIRSDPWGYLAPGWPEKAAELAYRDAWISHRRNGIYGEMFFAAAISAAFVVDDPVEAIRIGLTEIPRDCQLAKAVRWALQIAPKIRNYKQARAAVEKRFKGMSGVHTINNACLTIWGITIGRTNFSKVISETVAMGLDNDCTAATAGSIVGAVVGKKGVPRRWYAPFRNTVHSYLIRRPRFRIDDLLRRFETQAARVFEG